MIAAKTLFSALAVSVAVGNPVSALELIKGAKFTQTSNIVLSDPSKKALREFRRGNRAYGAFYTNKNGRNWVWYGSQFSAEDAARVTKAACEAVAKSPCVKVARIDPLNDVGGTGVPVTDQKDFREMIRDTQSSYYASFAINGTGRWGMAFDFGEIKDARATALSQCKEASDAERKEEDNANVRSALERKGLYKCRVIFSMQKG